MWYAEPCDDIFKGEYTPNHKLEKSSSNSKHLHQWGRYGTKPLPDSVKSINVVNEQAPFLKLKVCSDLAAI